MPTPAYRGRPSWSGRRPGAAGPADLLYADTVAAECAPPTPTSASGRAAAGRCWIGWPRTSVDRRTRGTCPRGSGSASRWPSSSCGAPPLLLLDEPTRGLDYGAKRRLVEILRELAAAGHAVLLSTHDVELVAEVATRVLVLAEGEMVRTARPRRHRRFPAFAPQVAKILAPQP